MKALRSLVAGLFGLVCLYFSLINIKNIPFKISPFHEIASFNLAFVVLLFFCFGFLCGACIVWLSGSEKRQQARVERKALKQSEEELKTLRNQDADKDYNLLQNQG
jgi:uncharacterized integral membrane protein